MTGLPKLDRIDINILAQLQQNSRLTNVDLAAAVGLSPSPCLARVRRLEKAGYIASGGYDYLLKFITRNVAHYQELMEAILERNIGIDKYFSYIVIKSVFLRENIDLKALLRDGGGSR